MLAIHSRSGGKWHGPSRSSAVLDVGPRAKTTRQRALVLYLGRSSPGATRPPLPLDDETACEDTDHAGLAAQVLVTTKWWRMTLVTEDMVDDLVARGAKPCSGPAHLAAVARTHCSDALCGVEAACETTECDRLDVWARVEQEAPDTATH